MLLLYRILLPAGLILLSPYFLFKSLKHGKYREGLKQRFGFDLPTLNGTHPRLWIHAVSVGEVLAVEPLIHRLAERYPRLQLIVSTTTPTGQHLAQTRFNQIATVVYFPLDLGGCVRRSWERIRPDMVVLAETEIWPRFIDEAVHRRVPIFLVNGRISDRSFRRYLWIRRPIADVLNKLILVMAQSEQDARRFREIGCSSDHLVVAGNLKFDHPSGPAVPSESLDWIRWIKEQRTDPIWVAGSTAAGEEQIVLQAFQILRREPGLSGLRLVLAPRHPERFQEVADLLRRLGLKFARRTGIKQDRDEADAEVILLDTLGELAALYAAADLVFIGGSLVPKGGHNILEAARLGKPIVVGPYMENFRSMLERFQSVDALAQLSERNASGQAEALAKVARAILRDPATGRRMGAHARACAEESRGATDRVLQLLAPHIEAMISASQACVPR